MLAFTVGHCWASIEGTVRPVVAVNDMNLNAAQGETP
jgi:hypothetical protein